MCCYTELLADEKVGGAFVGECHFSRISLKGAFFDVRFATSPSEDVAIVFKHFGLLSVVVVWWRHMTIIREPGCYGIGAVEHFTGSCWYWYCPR